MKADDLSWLPKTGSTVGGRYRVEQVIGQGGMGAVVSAVHVQLGERVAIKFLHPSLLEEEDSKQRFLREAKATALIKNEHVVRVLDVGMLDSGVPYIAMEYLDGEDLGRVLDRGPLPLVLAVDCLLQTAEALAEAHAAGIVHRDVKPSNLCLLRRADGSPLVKVLDFGISKLAPPGEEDQQLTTTRAVFGSPTYMSPEQIRSAKKVDARTDIWALGVVFHELLTCQFPFTGETISGLLASIAADPPTPLRAQRRDIPAAVEVAVLACLDKDPSRRLTLAELASALEPYGSMAARIAADRIRAIRAPMPQPSRPSLPSPSELPPRNAVEELGATEPQLATTQSVGVQFAAAKALPVGTSSRVALVLGALGIVAVAGVGGAVLVKQRRPQPVSAPAASSPPPMLSPAASEAPPVVSLTASVTAAPPASTSTQRASRPGAPAVTNTKRTASPAPSPLLIPSSAPPSNPPPSSSPTTSPTRQ